MPHTIKEKIRDWSRVVQDDVDYFSLYQQIEYLADNLFNEYEPCIGASHREFRDRLRDWLESAPSENDQQLLFQLVPYLFFVGNKEFDSLYETAFNGPIARWLIDVLDLKLNDPDIRTKLLHEVNNTWFCGITDSLQISKFYHINNIEGVDLRSDWRTLKATNGGADWIVRNMGDQGFERVVLLEDFVGSGSQIKKSIDFASTLSSQPKILICPLIVCPLGATLGRTIETTNAHITFSPVLELSQSMFLTPTAQQSEPDIYCDFRLLIERLHHLVSGTNWGQNYGPYGFKDTGGLTVMHTNCPDNTLPLIHHDSDGPWNAIFPRSSRLSQ